MHQSLTNKGERIKQLSYEEQALLIDELRAELHATQQRSRLTELMNDANGDVVLAIDKTKRVIAWNRACETMSGITKEEILGKELFAVFPAFEKRTELMQAIDQALQGFTVFVPADKQYADTEYSENHFMPLRDAAGEIIGVLNVRHDVAHRIKAENELKALNKALVKKNKELRQVYADLASFSHVTGNDLKEPLRKIYIFVEMLLEMEYAKLSEAGKANFKRIQAAIQRIGLLTDDILVYSNLHLDEKAKVRVDLNKAFAAASSELQDIIKSSNAIIKTVPLPEVKGDAEMLKQLFKNILSNALKFQPEGGRPVVQVTAELLAAGQVKHHEAIPDTAYWKISFADNGIGFDQKYEQQIFELFKRLHDKDVYTGTGVGLAVCKKVASLLFGFITVESIIGQGSVFHCYLPATTQGK